MSPIDRHAQAYLAHLERLPFVREARLDITDAQDRDVDGSVVLTTSAGKKVRLPVDHRRTHLTEEMAARIVHVGQTHLGLLVMAPVVGRLIAELFVAERINFVDRAGNCFVALGDDHVARIQGQRPEPREPEARALRAPAYRVLFALLADAHLLDVSARELAAASGAVSPQTANDLRARLVARGVLVKDETYAWAPRGRKEALDMLLQGFPLLRPMLLVGHYRAEKQNLHELEAELTDKLKDAGKWAWGGGAAAFRCTGHHRGTATIIYVENADLAATARLRLAKDSTGDITVMQVPGRCALEGPRPGVVHPLLIYIDLLAEGHELARHAAAEIYDRYLSDEASR